jgi:ubiquinone/menaquinone biosynthesis C-methylase UbiE
VENRREFETRAMQDVNHERNYPLGYTEAGFERLQSQGRFFRDLTEDLLRQAGIARGVPVLDIGSGVGGVSLLAGELVGPSGRVMGIERSTEAAQVALHSAVTAGQHWVSFCSTEIGEFASEDKFDAIIGRLILMYLPDSAETLRGLCRYLRSEGLVVSQELTMRLASSHPEGKEVRQCFDWIIETFARAGFEIDIGSKLFATFLRAVLPSPEMVLTGRVEGGPDSPVYDFLAGVLRSLLPVAEHLKVASADRFKSRRWLSESGMERP